MVKKEIEANQIRTNSVKQLYKTIYKRLNEINLDQSIKETLLQFYSSIMSDECVLEAIKEFPQFQRTYDIHKIKKILEAEINVLLKYYE